MSKWVDTAFIFRVQAIQDIHICIKNKRIQKSMLFEKKIGDLLKDNLNCKLRKKVQFLNKNMK